MALTIKYVKLHLGFSDGHEDILKLSYAEYKSRITPIKNNPASYGYSYIWAILVPVKNPSPDVDIISWSEKTGWLSWKRDCHAGRVKL